MIQGSRPGKLRPGWSTRRARCRRAAVGRRTCAAIVQHTGNPPFHFDQTILQIPGAASVGRGAQGAAAHVPAAQPGAAAEQLRGGVAAGTAQQQPQQQGLLQQQEDNADQPVPPAFVKARERAQAVQAAGQLPTWTGTGTAGTASHRNTEVISLFVPCVEVPLPVRASALSKSARRSACLVPFVQRTAVLSLLASLRARATAHPLGWLPLLAPDLQGTGLWPQCGKADPTRFVALLRSKDSKGAEELAKMLGVLGQFSPQQPAVLVSCMMRCWSAAQPKRRSPVLSMRCSSSTALRRMTLLRATGCSSCSECVEVCYTEWHAVI